MASGNTFVPTRHDQKETKTVAKSKGTSSKGAGKQKIQAGPSGKMQKFKGVGSQKPGVTSVSTSGSGSYAKK